MVANLSEPNWKLVLQALEALNGVASIAQIKEYFIENFHPESRAKNVSFDTKSITVNSNSRIYYAGGKQLRRTDTGNPYDRLFQRADKLYEFYDPAKHGVWEVAQNSQGTRYIRQAIEPVNDGSSDMLLYEVEEISDSEVINFPRDISRFAMESHLRDYLAQNLAYITGTPSTLDLFVDESGIPGVEYRTDIGIIDILAKGADGAFYVLELKLARGSDAVIGQILRYMGWVRHNLANGSPVYGVVVTSETSNKLKYAASEVPDIFVMEYELQFSLKMAEKL